MAQDLSSSRREEKKRLLSQDAALWTLAQHCGREEPKGITFHDVTNISPLPSLALAFHPSGLTKKQVTFYNYEKEFYVANDGFNEQILKKNGVRSQENNYKKRQNDTRGNRIMNMK